jgi:hypothetical protein
MCLNFGVSQFHTVEWGEFLHVREINDFLNEEFVGYAAPKELAAKALSCLCWFDCSDMDNAICVGVIKFLDDNCKCNHGHTNRNKRIIDLVKLLVTLHETPEDERQEPCVEWIDTRYD